MNIFKYLFGYEEVYNFPEDSLERLANLRGKLPTYNNTYCMWKFIKEQFPQIIWINVDEAEVVGDNIPKLVIKYKKYTYGGEYK